MSGGTATAIAGRYAYVPGYYSGVVAAVDLLDPGHPAVAGTSAFASSLVDATNITIANGFAYVVSKNRNGPSGSNSNDDGTGNSLTILDIATNPSHPAIVGSVHDAVRLFGSYGVAVQGRYAYVAAQGCLSGQPCPNTNVGDAFTVIDISNPAAPTVVATVKNNSLPAPWTGTGALKHPTSVAISGHYAFVTASYANRLTVLDIANPLAPVIVASPQDASKLAFDVDVTVANGYAYVADQAQGVGRVAVVDVHTPASPQLLGVVTNSTWLNGAYRIKALGKFVYVAATYAASVSAVDVSDPNAPRFAGGYKSTTLLNRAPGLDIDPTGVYLVAVSPFLSTTTQPTYPPFPPSSGAPVLTGTVAVVVLDPAPASVTIAAASKPANPTSQTSASFSFSTGDAVATVQCRLDNQPTGPCTSATTQTYTSLSPATHTFTVTATGANGATATASYTWTIGTSTPVAPANSVLPSLSGSPVQGQSLVANPGSWTGSPAPSFAYQWQRCNSSGAGCVSVTGATGSSYLLGSADVGGTVRVVVTGSNSAGSRAATSAVSGVVSGVVTPPSGGPKDPILDNFNRASGPIGANWGQIFGGLVDLSIVAGEAVDPSTTSFAWNYWSARQFGPDSEAYVTVTTLSADAVRVCARMANPTTSNRSGYCTQVSGSSWTIRQLDSGPAPQLGTAATQSLTAGSRIGITVVGSTITAWYSPSPTAAWTQITSVSDTTYPGPGYIAVETRASHVDDFGGGTH